MQERVAHDPCLISKQRLDPTVTFDGFTRAWQGHSKWITSIAWEPAHLALPSRRFVTGSKDTSIRVWDAVTRQTLFSMSSHTLAVSCVKWGGDGLIYSASKDCTINVWSGAVRISAASSCR